MRKFFTWICKILALIIGVSLGAALLGVPWVLFLQSKFDEDVDLTIITRLPLEAWSLIAGVGVIALLLRFERATLREAFFRRTGILSHTSIGGLIGMTAAGFSAMLILFVGHAAVNPDFTMVAMDLILLLAVSVLLNALLQEMMFRGYFLYISKQTYGQTFAILASSFGFVLVHGGVYSGTEGLITGASLFLAGLGMAFMVLATRSIWLATGCHWGWNMSQSFLSDGVTNKAYSEGAPLIMEAGTTSGTNFEHTVFGLLGPAVIAVCAFIYWRYAEKRTDFGQKA